MKSRVNAGHLLMIFCLLIYITKYKFLAGIFSLLANLLSLMFSDPGYALNQLEINLADHFISVILISVLPVMVIKEWKRLSRIKLNFNTIVIIALALLFVFAPVISNTNPEAGRDLRVTKLLPPFSSLKVFHLQSNAGNDFFNKKNNILSNSLNNSIIFGDSISVNDDVKVYQQGRIKAFPREIVVFENSKVKAGSFLFILGTDEYGRDIFSRLVYGARISLLTGCGAVIITFILGVGLGFIAGYSGGIIDIILNRISDMLLSFPVVFLIILLVALFGSSLLTVILVLGYSGWMALFKIVRGEVISVKSKDYFISARLAGIGGKNLLLKEIFPVIIAPVIVNLIFQYGNVILAESALSFLGLGTGNTYPSWGSMIDSGQQYLEQAWWMILFPGLALIITLFTANNLGKEISLYFNPGLKDDK